MDGWLSRQFAALVLLATILVVLPGSGAAAQHWFEPIPLQPQLTRIYGMLGYVMPGEEGITAAAYVNGKGTLVVAGQGYVAGVDLESMSIVWRQSLIGTATTSSVYSPTADWVVVGSDSGEIVAINLDDPAVRADFYTAGREAVVSVYSMEFDGGLSIVAQDSLGALYLYALGEPGWLEFATEASNGAYKSYIVGEQGFSRMVGEFELSGYDSRVATGRVLAFFEGASSVISGLPTQPDALVQVSREASEVFGDLAGAVVANAYYEDPGGALLPAATQVVEQEGLVIYKTLMYAATPASGEGYVIPVMAYNGLTQSINYYGFSVAPDNSNLVAFSFPATKFRLVVLYTIQEEDAATGEIIRFYCYAYEQIIDLGPREVIDLGNINLRLVEAGSLEECMSELNVKPAGDGFSAFHPILVLDAASTPSQFNYKEDAMIALIPTGIDDNSSIDDASFIASFKLSGGPLTQAGVSRVLVVGDEASVIVYLLDEQWGLVEGVVNPVIYYLAADVTTAAISPDGTRLYIGTSRGSVYLFLWDGSRYYAAEALVIDSTGEITSIVELAGGGYAVFASSNGVVQLVDVESWKPMWRGLPGFYGILTGIPYPVLMGASLNPLYAVSLGGPVIYVFKPGGFDLNTIIIDLSITITRADGSVENASAPEGSYVVLLSPEGEPLALDYVAGDRALLYAPTGDYEVLVSLSGLGDALADLRVEPQIVRESYAFSFRQVKFYVFTPTTPPSPEASVAYKLLSGPRPGAKLIFNIINYYGAGGYIPLTSTFETFTDENGEAEAILWDQTVYTVTAELEGFISGSIVFDSGENLYAEVELHPILHTITIKAIDSEVYRQLGEELLVRNAQIIFQLGDRSASIEAPEGEALLLLGTGTYTIIVQAPAYAVAVEEGVSIAGATTLTILVEPVKFDAILVVNLVDEIAGVANGPIEGVRVSAILVDPALEYYAEGVTDENGRAILTGLRSGVYRIIISDPVIGEVVVDGVQIDGSGETLINVEPKYASVRLNLLDGEYLTPAAGSFNVILVYHRIQGAQASIVVEEPIISLQLPRGLYTIIINSREGYYYDYTKYFEQIQSDVEYTISLEPVRVQVRLQVVYNDTETGLATGGVPGALVELNLVEPDLPFGNMTVITDSGGVVVLTLRAGVYEARITSSLTEEATARFTVSGAAGEAVILVTVKPLYADLIVNLYDKDVFVPVPVAQLEIKWIGAGGPSSSKVLIVEGGSAEVRVPLGLLELTASLDGYYRPTTARIEVNLPGTQTYTILMEPLLVDATITVLTSPVAAEIGGVPITLPQAPLPGVRVTLVPDDPLLEYLGVQPVSTTTGETGVAVLPVRGGTYKIIVQSPVAEGYEAIVSLSDANKDVVVQVKPFLYNVKLTILDPDLTPEASAPEAVLLVLDSFNGVNIGARIVVGASVDAVLPAGRYVVVLQSEGYAETIHELVIAGESSLTLTLKPQLRTVTFTIIAETVFGTTSEIAGVLVLEARDIPLKNPVIAVDVINGVSVAQLRLGTYIVYYTMPDLGIQIQLAEIRVDQGEQPLNVELRMQVPKVSLAVAFRDSELDTSVANVSVSIIYNGPFGQHAMVIDAAEGSLQVEVPPGYIFIDAEAPGYQPLRSDIVARGDRVDAVLPMDPLVYNVQIRLVDQDGYPVEVPVRIVFIHSELPYTKTVEGEGPVIDVRGIRPGIYQVIIEPPVDSRLDRTQLEIAIDPPGVATPDTLTVNFKSYTVTLVLVDADRGNEIPFPYIARIERVATGAPSPLEFGMEVAIQGRVDVKLPYGTYILSLVPEGPDYYVTDEPFMITVERTGEIPLRLQPRVYTVTIVVTDDNGAPLANALVRVVDAEGNEVQSGYTDSNGIFVFRAIFGTYGIEVNHPGFYTESRTISVPQSTSVTISLEPGIRVLLLRYGPLVTGFAGLIIIGVLIYRMRHVLSEKLMKEEEYF